ncbi:MAG: pyridoxal phosphate-dependent aminotransferase [Treponema sp.]|nr:pyridoxal phosphate-dependent aminotransferase [Treponema sp.]
MAIAKGVKDALSSSSMIRKMFEEGNLLKKRYGADKVFDFSLGNPDIEPPPAFHQVFLRFAQDDAAGRSKGVHGYMSNPGFPAVREALAKKASREQGVMLEGSHIIMAVGAAGGLNVVFKTILNSGDEVLTPRPYFMEYKGYTANHGGILREVDSLPDFNLDLDGIRNGLNEKTAAVLINSPHNPTGRVYPAATLHALAEILEAHGKKTGRWPFLVADEPYREIVYIPGGTPPLLSVYRNSISVTSYSKSLSLPGERIGYIAVNPDIQDEEDLLNGLIYATRILGYINAPALMQRIVAELTEESVDVRVYARRRDAFKEVLDKASIPYAEPQGAFYLFCRVPPKKGGSNPVGDDGAFVNHLKQHLILGVPGSGFGKPGWVRFAYCVDETVIRTAGEAFKKAMETWA